MLLKIDLIDSWAELKFQLWPIICQLKSGILTKISANLEISPMYLPLAGMELKINVTYMHFTSEQR